MPKTITVSLPVADLQWAKALDVSAMPERSA